jgi:hypothetical protein
VVHADTPQAGLSVSVRPLEDGARYAVDVVTTPAMPEQTLKARLRLVIKDFKIHYVYVPLTGRIVDDRDKKAEEKK